MRLSDLSFVSGHDFSRADKALHSFLSRAGFSPRGKRGLVRDPGDWKWSSFRHYAFREMGVVEIESEWTGRDREIKVTGGQPRVFPCPS